MTPILGGYGNPALEGMMELRDHARTLLGSSKFDSRRTRILYAASLDGTDREAGTVDDYGWHGRLGRYVVREDNYGNVDHLTFATAAEADAYLDSIDNAGENENPDGRGDEAEHYEDAAPNWYAGMAPDEHLEAAYEDAASMGGGDVDL